MFISTGIFMNRVWYSFGHPVYATLQRYLLLDTWILSQAATRKCRGLFLGLLFLLLPILLLLGAACSIHALGFVNVQSCGPLTGVYYVSKPVCVSCFHEYYSFLKTYNLQQLCTL